MSTSVVDNPFIGQRIRELRRRQELSQEALAASMGLPYRQTLQSIESGERRLHVHELLRLIEVTGTSIEFFTDPFLWTGDGKFSYRAQSPNEEVLSRFEADAGSWVALWRWLGAVSERRVGAHPTFDLGSKVSFEDAQAFAEQLVRWLQLGDRPAGGLAETIEHEFGVPVLFVDMPEGISGATCHLNNDNILFVNRNDAPGRRNFDLAHELFHVLTWAQQEPERIDRETTDGAASSTDNKDNRRVEKLANNFASALLMPRKHALQCWKRCTDADDLATELRACAEYFQVTVPAFLWRLVALGCIKSGDVAELAANPARQSTGQEVVLETPHIFSKYFFTYAGEALSSGRISVRRLAKLLHLDIDQLGSAFRSHNLEVPFDI